MNLSLNLCTCDNMIVEYFTNEPFVAKCARCSGYRKIKPKDMPK